MVKLDDIIKGQINEREDMGTGSYARLLRIAIDGLKQLHMDVSGISTTIVLDIDPNTYTANLPVDYLAVNRVSMCIHERLFPLMQDNSICLNRSVDNCGEPEPYQNYPINNNSNGYYWNMYGFQNSNWRGGEYIGRNFGRGAGVSVYGRYRIDIENGWIQFQMTPLHLSREIVFEYLAQPHMINGDFYVHEYDVEALNAYIYWASIRSKTNFPSGEKERASREFYRQKNDAMLRHQSFTLDQAYQAVRRTFQLSPKG